MRKKLRLAFSGLAVVPVIIAATAGCSSSPSLSVTSSAFADKASIPANYTCAGENISPPLSWSDVPQGTQSFAIIVDDEDAVVSGRQSPNNYTHWVMYNIPPSINHFDEGMPTTEQLAQGIQGTNDAGTIGYSGPCPPPGQLHHYRFTVYALNNTLSLGAGATRQDLLTAMYSHVLAAGQLVGTYQS